MDGWSEKNCPGMKGHPILTNQATKYTRGEVESGRGGLLHSGSLLLLLSSPHSAKRSGDQPCVRPYPTWVVAASAALALSVREGAGIIGRLGVGFAIDRVSPERIQSLVLALAAAGTLILAFAGSAWAALLGAAVLGVGLGSEADVVLAH